MIHICDLICKEMSHEKVNSGFIYGLRLAFPDEKITFYADITHINAIDEILKHDDINISNLDYHPVKISSQSNLLYYPKCYFLIKNIFKIVRSSGDNKIFFLSFNNVILHIIKKLKLHSLFADFKFALVLHGDFEQIAGTVNDSGVITVPTSSLTERLKRYPLSSWPEKLIRLVLRRLLGMYQNKVTSLYSKFLTLKELLFLHHSIDYKYIALSTHIVDNARKQLEVEKLNIHVVTMPTVFRPTEKIERSLYPKFAIFGYGNSIISHQVMTKLSKLNLSEPYEIRNIGMNNSGMEGFTNVTLTSSGNRLTRSEMEAHARDVDIFLIFHPSNTYSLSCSASIFEALSYEKPILHFNNDCINTYNTKEMPIGFSANTIEEYVDNMASIIKNYDEFLSDRNLFISNIRKLRNIYSIEKSKEDISKVYRWPDEVERPN